MVRESDTKKPFLIKEPDHHHAIDTYKVSQTHASCEESSNHASSENKSAEDDEEFFFAVTQQE